MPISKIGSNCQSLFIISKLYDKSEKNILSWIFLPKLVLPIVWLDCTKTSPSKDDCIILTQDRPIESLSLYKYIPEEKSIDPELYVDSEKAGSLFSGRSSKSKLIE